jgi:hypothetical protein
MAAPRIYAFYPYIPIGYGYHKHLQPVKKAPYASSLDIPGSKRALRPRCYAACPCSLLEHILFKRSMCLKDVADPFPANALLTVSQNGAAVVPQNGTTVVPTQRSLMGEKDHTCQPSVWLSPEDRAWIDAQLQESTHVGGCRGGTRPACVRSLRRTARPRTSLQRESVTSAAERTERLRAHHAFPQGRARHER